MDFRYLCRSWNCHELRCSQGSAFNYIDELYLGELAEVEEMEKCDNLHGTPTYWWPVDKTRCIYIDIDLNLSLIGGSPELIEALLADDFLECIECDATNRNDNMTDYTNNE